MFKRSRYTMKDAEAALIAHNERNADTLELHAAYGGYKVVRRQPNGGYLDAAKVGRGGYQSTPRAALDAAGVLV